MTYQLKIKIKSLAAEARIIRHEERKAKASKLWHRTRQHKEDADRYWWVQIDLHHHRTFDVRRASRAALLAYAFLRNRPYKTVEQKAHSLPGWWASYPWVPAQKLITKYGNGRAPAQGNNLSDEFKAWILAGEEKTESAPTSAQEPQQQPTAA